MSNDERAQSISTNSPESDSNTAPIVESSEPLASTSPGRWAAVTVPARQHPIGLAVGAAVVGLVVGLLGGLAVDAHPMMSLTVGTAPAPVANDRPNPGVLPPGPAGERGGPGVDGPDGPPPPGPHLHVQVGPGGAPEPGGELPPPAGGPAPIPPGATAGPGGATTAPPLPAERGGATQPS